MKWVKYEDSFVNVEAIVRVRKSDGVYSRVILGTESHKVWVIELSNGNEIREHDLESILPLLIAAGIPTEGLSSEGRINNEIVPD